MEPTMSVQESTTDRMSDEEYASIIDNGPIGRSEVAQDTVKEAEFKRWTRLALFDNDMAKIYWPLLMVDAFWGEHSLWQIVEAGWEYSNLQEMYEKKGIKGRPFRVTMMPGANHFVSVPCPSYKVHDLLILFRCIGTSQSEPCSSFPM